ncbi:MAG TPA: cobaltochelatase subunit CobN, partial [Dehalococcoidia bacterium]|nr:cobaltochelatase subunit CobN [Dehalococcoidia bacterium]
MILFVTTADTDLLTADRALEDLPADFPEVKAFNPANMSSPASIKASPDGTSSDSPEESEQQAILTAAAEADVVVLRLLGGKRAMPEMFDPLVRICHDRGIPLIACPGHQEWDQELVTACNVPPSELDAIFSYLIRGGVPNFQNLFLFLSDSYLGSDYGHEAPAEVPWEGVYHPEEADGLTAQDFVDRRFQPDRPNIAILFYRAHWMSGNLLTIDSLINRFDELGANVLPVYSFSLKHNPEGDGQGNRTFSEILCDANGKSRVHCIVNTMGMSMTDLQQDGATFATGPQVDYLDQLNVPIIQGIFSTGSESDWDKSELGLGPIDTAMNVALPEFDGRIITVPISFKEEVASAVNGRSGKMDARLQRNIPRPDRVDFLARLSVKWAGLRLKTNAEKRIAIILSNYPTKDARVGNAVGLDTPASVVNILNAMKDAGYHVTDIPEDGDELVHRIIERCSNDTDTLTEEQLRLAAGHVTGKQYKDWFTTFPKQVQTELRAAWGEPPGQVYRTGDDLAIAGIDLGNVFVGLQPPRGFGENPIAVYHSPDLAPTHHYVAYYRWVRDVFKADAMVHVGKHGTMEWLPGKGIGLSNTCYPEVTLEDVPLFYPFIINNPGEGAQAKRRAHATIIDHLIPPMTTADSYGDIARLEQLMDEHYQCQTLDPAKLPMLEGQIWDMVRQADLDRDLGVDEQPEDFGGFILHIDGYLCELKDAQIRDGLHTLGEVPADDQMTGLLSSLTRLDTGGIPSLRRSLAEAMGLDYTSLLDEPSLPAPDPVPAQLAVNDDTPVRTQGDLLERLELLSRTAYTLLDAGGFRSQDVAGTVEQLLGTSDAQASQVLNYVTDTLHPALLKTTDEIGNLLRGLNGQFVPAGPSGAPTRGMSNILPTGRNFYSVDPKTIPSPTAWDMGVGLADALLKMYIEEEGSYPEMVGLVIWGTS